MKNEYIWENQVEVVQDENDKTMYHFTWTPQPSITHTQDDLMRRMEMSIVAKDINKTFTQAEIDIIVIIVCNMSPWMTMGCAIEILGNGLAYKYVENNELRTMVDLWAKTRFAELTLAEFLANVSSNAS